MLARGELACGHVDKNPRIRREEQMRKVTGSVALAGGIALAAIAGPAVAGPTVTFETFIAVPADTANMQPGGAFSAFDGRVVDPERAVAVTAVKDCDPARSDRQNAIGAGHRGCRLLPGKPGGPAKKCQAGSRKDTDTGIGPVGDKDVSSHRVREAESGGTDPGASADINQRYDPG